MAPRLDLLLPGQRPPEAPPSARIRMDEADVGARTVLAAAGQMQQAAERQRAQRRLELRTEALRDLAQLDAAFARNQDHATMEGSYAEAANRLVRSYGERLAGDPEGAALFEATMQGQLAAGAREVGRRAIALRSDAFTAGLRDSFNEMVRQAAGNPEREGAAREQIEAMIADGVSAGLMSQTDAQGVRQRFASQVVSARVQQDMRADPGGTARRLADPNQYADLEPAQRERLQDMALRRAEMAQRQAIAGAERRERMAEREQRRVEGDTAKEGTALLARGELTLEWVETNRGNLSVNEYQALRRRIGPSGIAEPERDDAAAIVAMAQAIDSPGGEFGALGVRLLATGLLRTETYLSLMERNRQARRDDQPASPYRAGLAFVRTSLDPGQFFGSSFDRQAYTVAQASAIMDFDAWSRANPDAGPAEAEARAREIVRRYSDGTAEQMRQRLPLPFRSAVPRSQITQEVVDRAALALSDAMAEGRISPAEAAREADALRAWSQTLAGREARASAQRPSGPPQDSPAALPPPRAPARAAGGAPTGVTTPPAAPDGADAAAEERRRRWRERGRVSEPPAPEVQ